MILPRQPYPRRTYESHLKKLGNGCAFCPMREDFIISSFGSWNWVYAAFPYRKYHSLLVPLRHVVSFSALETEEIIDMQAAVQTIEEKYRSSGILGQGSEFGDQLFFSWRSRNDPKAKNPVAHFHLHIYPKFGGADDLPLDPESHLIDPARLAA